MRSVGILSLGCKVNMYEAEFVQNKLAQAGYQICNFEDICDVYIINTCTVTNTSDAKSKKMIRSAIRRNPNACVVAMGCFIAANFDYHEEGLDIVIGNKDKGKIVEILEEYFQKRQVLIDSYKGRLKEFEDMYIQEFPGRTRAFVKIQDGCDNFCSYCIIPFVRGKCRSKEEDQVVEEVSGLVSNGYQEIVLTGIHTGSYGVDLNTNFAHLLRRLVSIKGLLRLRISSIEVTELDKEVLEILKESPILVDHLHIPLQAGSDEILKAMNRKYDLIYYQNKIEEIRSIRPNISISTDVIVGFPGESEELFQKTIDTCKQFGFSKIHVFPFSERKGTVAATLDHKIEGHAKKDRSRRLIQVSHELEEMYMKKFMNCDVEVLVEEAKDGYSYGHTENFLYVKIKGKYEHQSVLTVHISEVQYPYCIGEVI